MKKILLSSVFIVALAALSVGIVPKASAATYDNGRSYQTNNYRNGYYQMLGNRGYNYSDMMHNYRVREYNDYARRNIRNYDMHRPLVRIASDQDFFNRHNLFFFHPEFRSYFPSDIFARRIIFIDRDDVRNRIDIDNFLTGPYSLNEADITIDHDTFVRLQNQVDVDQNVNISVNTGNNTISFNTVVGNVTTGDVNISVR